MTKASPITKAQVSTIVNKLPAGNISLSDIKRVLVENGFTESQYPSILNDSRIVKVSHGTYYRKSLKIINREQLADTPPHSDQKIELTEEASISFLKDRGYQIFKRVEV